MNQSEIWLIDLEPTKGSEINKKRPAIIVNVDGLGKLPLKVIIPITESKDRYEIAPWMVKISPSAKNGLYKESAADCFQIRSVSEERLVAKLGFIEKDDLNTIKNAINIIIGL